MIVYGEVLGVKYRSEDFHILIMAVHRASPAAPKKVISVSGNFYGLLQVTPGTTIGVIGDLTSHPKYGLQLVPSGWEPYAETALQVEQFLGECVDGFGNPLMAGLLASKFGVALFEKMVLAPEDVRALAGDDESLRLEIDIALDKWRQTRVMANLASLLRAVELPAHVILAVHKKFGDDALNVVTSNPYRLVQVEGVTFGAADRLAKQIGIEGRDIRRVEGAVLWFLHQGAKEGHLFMRRGDLPKLIDGLVEHEFIDPFERDVAEALPEAIQSLVARGDVFLDARAGIYLEAYWKYERESAARLAKFVTAPEGVVVDIDMEDFLSEYERGHQIELSSAQRDGVTKLLKNRVLVVTGLPGTGKTTLVKAFVALFRRAGISTALMAPTGIASKRLSAVTGSDTATIHRTFGFDGKNWRYRADNKYSTEAVIVDEMSMVDMELFYRILDALHPTTMLVLVGDDAQLPSVGPGNVLRELLKTPEIPHIRLTQIFRQAHTSEIVLASHQINRGETPDLSPRPASSEFQFVNCSDDEKLAPFIVKMAEKLKNRDANFQVLAPKYDGIVGVTNLNNLLREALNPDKGQKSWRGGPLHVREGDRLMVIKNDYDKSIYNGDMGKLVRITKDSLFLRIHGIGANAIDMEVEVPKTEAPDKLRLAYAITVHKCVDPDTLVETPAGLVRAGALPEEGVVATPTGRAAYRGFVRNPVAPMLEIETTDGYRLRVTPDHLVDRWGDQGYEPVRADALMERDFLRLRLGHEFDGGALASLPEPPRADVRARLHRIPREVCVDVAEFLGMCVADATVYPKGFRLAKRHLDYADRFDALCRTLFGVEPRRYFANHAHHVEVNSTLLSRWLLSVGGLAPRDKRVPDSVLASPVAVQARFLRGLFEDGSVHLRKGGVLDHVELFSSSENVVRSVKVLLLRLGIISGVSRRDGGTSVCVYGQNARRFASLVGLITASKVERLTAPPGKETRYLVPVLKSELRGLVKAGGRAAPMTFAVKNALSRGTMSRHQLARFLSKAEKSSPGWTTLNDRLGFHHGRIRSIRPYMGASVCIEVPEGHQFVQDGFCGWNSQGSEFDTVILPLVRAHGRMRQRNLFYTAITRAKKKCWLLGDPVSVQAAIANDLVVQRNTFFGEAVSEAIAGVSKGP